MLLITAQGFSQGRYELKKYQGLAGDAFVNDIVLGDGISSYIACKKGLFYVPSVGSESRTIMPNKDVSAVSNPSGTTFFFSHDNTYSYSLNLSEPKSFGDKNTDVNCLLEIGEVLWIGTNQGIYTINTSKNKVTHHYTSKNSKLVSDVINFIYKDNFGVIWIGTSKGIVRIVDGDWKSLYEKGHAMRTIYENKEGLWLLSDTELWNIDNIDRANRWYRMNLKKDLVKGKVNDLVIDSKGRLIIASDLLVRFDPFTDELSRYGKELGGVSKKCTALAIDSEDKLWIGTGGDGLFTVGFREHLKKNKDTAPLEIALVGKSPSCHDGLDGSVKLLLKGGKKPFTYQWSTGDDDVKKIENLIAGNYSVTVSDSKNDTIVKSIDIINPKQLKAKLDKVTYNIDGTGNVGFVISGGTPGYRIDINGATYGNPVKNLGKGSYTAKIYDVFGCEEVVDFDIEGKKIMSELDKELMVVGKTLEIKNLYFKADSVEITTKSKPALDEIFNFLNSNKGIVVEIGGHTNNIPTNEYCDRLSTNRAKNVAEYLVNKGIARERISYKGYGKRKPIASNKTSAGRKKNQRVEMKILSIGKE